MYMQVHQNADTRRFKVEYTWVYILIRQSGKNDKNDR